MEKFAYKLPDLTKTQARIDRGPGLCNGEFTLKINRLRPKNVRTGGFAIIGEFTVTAIIRQEPTFHYSTGVQLPVISVGQRVDHYFAFGGEYGYGESEWTNLLDALNVPPAERNPVTEGFLGEENLAMGKDVNVRRQGIKTWFSPVK